MIRHHVASINCRYWGQWKLWPFWTSHAQFPWLKGTTCHLKLSWKLKTIYALFIYKLVDWLYYINLSNCSFEIFCFYLDFSVTLKAVVSNTLVQNKLHKKLWTTVVSNFRIDNTKIVNLSHFFSISRHIIRHMIQWINKLI